ncbi:MAG: acyl-CoA dehydrogenase family protein, partial [Acidimicrobiales bacterium]
MRYPRQPSIYLSEEHDEFRRTVARFVDREIRPQATEWEAAGECDRDLYRKAAKVGLLGLRYDPDLGGSGLDFLATCVLAEELAKGDSVGTAVALMAQSEFALAILADSVTTLSEDEASELVAVIAGVALRDAIATSSAEESLRWLRQLSQERPTALSPVQVLALTLADEGREETAVALVLRHGLEPDL